ncbi:MAG TPA: alpha/beta hydrolase [Acidimicrobiia bacterium]|nr:alpha/beta hydrolase [Acidimicrobiia bacterium]
MDFVLVHGAYHGAWCWDLVANELTQRGQRVVTVDLPIDDPDAGLLAYRDSILQAAEGLESPVVVGHSMGGAIIPLVAESRPISRLVFLSAFVPSPGRSLNQLRASEPLETYRLTNVEFHDLGNRVWTIGAATARELFFHDVSDELASWAQQLLRPQSYGVFDEASPLRAWPDVSSAYIVCGQDRALDPEWSRATARDRLGVTAIELSGGHSPFLARPVELASALETAAEG